MFQNLLMAVKANISAIRSIIKTNEKIRDIAFGDVSLRTEEIQQLLINISQDIPELTDWRVYDHCAVVTRLYAIYETFVEDLIEDWLILLPSLYSNYSELNETIRKTHQSGVGRLLQEILKEDNHRYKNLSTQQVMYGLLNGETSKSYCQLATIETIQDNNNFITDPDFKTTPGMELGLKFDVDARKDLRLYQLIT
ncbi:MAG: hypothetical protein HEQ29_07725 [Dolichospermum sp. LBC05a]|nr:hypothetical protein [Dolichospermum sp. OL01]MCO5796676.1 hypothetical protein [Dolichospermum sp. OL03]MCS6281839.1 hypothetical protein [Dolichospermum sp.]QSV58264.1 MAG: hypothetical protein HEQ29_07725 [Dolichospermum sp. LBC05a]